MKSIEAWAIFRAEELQNDWLSHCSAFAINKTRAAAREMQRLGERVVKVKIEWEEK